MDEINEQTENMKQIQEALSAPIGAVADLDDVPIHFVFLICKFVKFINILINEYFCFMAG